MDVFQIFTDLSQAISDIRTGNVVAIGAFITVAIRLYRLIPKAPWVSERTAWIVPVVSFSVGFIATMLTSALAFKATWGAAVLAGLGVAVNAAGFNSVSKAAVKAVTANVQPTNPTIKSAGSLRVPPPTP